MSVVEAGFTWPCDFLGPEELCTVVYRVNGVPKKKRIRLSKCSADIRAKVAEWKEVCTVCKVGGSVSDPKQVPPALQVMRLRFDTKLKTVEEQREEEEEWNSPVQDEWSSMIDMDDGAVDYYD